MADPSSHTSNKTHFQDPNRSSIPTKPPKSKFLFISYFFSKSLIIILVLLVFYFFPSQVPDFFNKTTLITKLWELIYLLVIGIAVCYGLFSKKVDSVHSCEELADDNIDANETYLSGISHISSIFEDRVQDFNRFNEKDLFEFGNGFEKSDGKKLNHRYFLGKPKSIKQNKPLCLPVRNIGSKSVDSDNKKSINEDFPNDEQYGVEELGNPKTIKQNLGSKSLDSGFGKKSVNDSSTGWDGIKKQKFRGLVPIKLEEKFKEAKSDSDSDSDSRIPLNWRSKSMRLEKRDEEFRPDSVGNLDFECLKSQSMRISMQPHMKNSSENEELKGMDPNLIFETSLMESKQKEVFEVFGKFEVDDGTNKKSKSQRSSEMNLLGEGEKSDSSNHIINPAPIASTYRRGKSVRTSRPKEQVVEAKVNATFLSQTGDTNVKMDELSDTEPHSGEVDRKAEEFIAKFREQIRLQKVASARKLNLW